MNNLAHPVNVVKANETLAGEFANKWQWHAFIVVSFNDLQEVHTQNLKHHNKMLTIRSMMDKRIKKLGTM